MILREEDDGGRVMVMSDDERVRPFAICHAISASSRQRTTNQKDELHGGDAGYRKQ